MSKWRCLVIGCDHVANTGAERNRFFPFPQAPLARSIWLTNVKRGVYFKPARNDCVCAKHFVDGHPTTKNPYPEVDMGWECPKRHVAPSSQLDVMNRPTASSMAAQVAKAKSERAEARRLLGMPEDLTPEEKSIPQPSKPISSYSDFCSVAGCPNCCYVLRRMGLRCEVPLFPIPSNDTTLSDQWMNFARLKNNYAKQQMKLRGQICALHFVDGCPTAENPYPTIYPELESYPTLVSRSKSESSATIWKNGKFEQNSGQKRICYKDMQISLPPKLTKYSEPDSLHSDSDSSPSLLLTRLKSRFLTDTEHCRDLIGLKPEVFAVLLDFIKENELTLKPKCFTAILESGQLSLEACLIGTLMKLKLLTTDEILSAIFSVDIQQLRQSLCKFIEQFSNYARCLIFWPENDNVDNVSVNFDNQRIVGILDCVNLNYSDSSSNSNDATFYRETTPTYYKFVLVYNLKGAVIYRSRLYGSADTTTTTTKDSAIVEQIFNAENLREFLQIHDDHALFVTKASLLPKNSDFCNIKLKPLPNLHIKQLVEREFLGRSKSLAIFNRPYTDQEIKPYKSVYDSMITIGCLLLSLSEEINIDFLV